jgi:hypothetical protein
MPARTNAFQRLITLLTATLDGQARAVESAMLPDRVTGELREVDILVTSTTASFSISLGIEVIAWARPADTPWIEKMRAKHENLATDKLILVSESGFSGPAKRKAEFHGIETITIEEACDADWKLIAELSETGAFNVTTLNYDVEAVCQLPDGTLEQLPVPTGAVLPMATGHLTMDAFVRRLLDLDALRDAVRANLTGPHEHDFWLSYTDPRGLWRIDHDGKSGEITELRIGLKVLQTISPVRFATGKFRSVPFVSGTSTAGAAPLQFVLARNADGSSSGYLIDGAGTRTLSSRSQTPPEAPAN